MIDVIILGAAHQHVDYLFTEVAASSDLTIVAAAEPNSDARARFLSGLTVPVYVDPLLALESHPAAVAVICGIYSQRAELVVACLERGMAVLTDKPLCTDLDQLAAIERAAAVAPGPLAIMLDKRFYPETRALMGLVADGRLGDVVEVDSTGPHKLLRDSRPDWFFDRPGYGGIANDLPVHDIDILLQLVAPTAGRVSALSGNRLFPDRLGFDDHVVLLLDLPGVQAVIEANWLQPEAAEVHGHYRMRVVGTEGTAELDWARHRVTITTHQAAEQIVQLPEPVRPVQFFFDPIRAGHQPAVTTEESLRATRIALTAQRSADHDGAWHSFLC